jgi:hypothetical protein
VSTRSTRRTVLCAAAALAACSALTGGATSASADTKNEQQADQRASLNLLAVQSQQWDGWKHAPEAGLTFDAPAVTTYNNKLYAFVRGTDNGLHFASFNGTSWDGSHSVPGGGLTLNAPAVTSYNNKLYLVTRGSTGNGIHYNRIS